MKIIVPIKVKTCFGEIKEVEEAKIFVETDQKERKFYKIEGKKGIETFMIDYSYQKKEIFTKFVNIVNLLLEKQIEKKIEN